MIDLKETMFCQSCEVLYSWKEGRGVCPRCKSHFSQSSIINWIVPLGKASIKAEPIDLRAGYQEVQPCI